MTATVVVRRKKSRFRGRLDRYAVNVDGEQVGFLNNGQSLTVAVSPGEHKIRLSIFRRPFAGSPELEFKLGASETKRFVCEPYDLLGSERYVLFSSDTSLIRLRDDDD
jgi:hypothetical protein